MLRSLNVATPPTVVCVSVPFRVPDPSNATVTATPSTGGGSIACSIQQLHGDRLADDPRPRFHTGRSPGVCHLGMPPRPRWRRNSQEQRQGCHSTKEGPSRPAARTPKVINQAGPCTRSSRWVVLPSSVPVPEFKDSGDRHPRLRNVVMASYASISCTVTGGAIVAPSRGTRRSPGHTQACKALQRRRRARLLTFDETGVSNGWPANCRLIVYAFSGFRETPVCDHGLLSPS